MTRAREKAVILDPADRPVGDRSSQGTASDAIPRYFGWRRVYYATLFSAAGLRAAWIHEAAFRQECLLAAALAPVAFWLGRDAAEISLLLGSCVLVLIVELLNSAVEAAIDRVGTDHHLLSARAKDLGSAAVLMSLALTAIVWALIAWQRFF
jgi:diacylglycerol kinase (ATP)